MTVPIDAITVDLWFHYEEVAMHFNGLIIQYRLNLMGGLGVLGTGLAYVYGVRGSDALSLYRFRALVSVILAFILIAAASLDLFYYNELLRGAVKAISKLEEQHSELYLSSFIKSQFTHPYTATFRLGIVYALIIVPLVVFSIWSCLVYFREWNSANNVKVLMSERVHGFMIVAFGLTYFFCLVALFNYNAIDSSFYLLLAMAVIQSLALGFLIFMKKSIVT